MKSSMRMLDKVVLDDLTSMEKMKENEFFVIGGSKGIGLEINLLGAVQSMQAYFYRFTGPVGSAPCPAFQEADGPGQHPQMTYTPR